MISQSSTSILAELRRIYSMPLALAFSSVLIELKSINYRSDYLRPNELYESKLKQEH
jgi:hypothetical protein